jgi:hypothetical protein
MLGIDDALPDPLVDAIVAGTHPQDVWDGDGFRAGITDMLDVRQTPPTVAAFLASADVRVSRAELSLIHAELGGRGEFSLPPELGSWLTTGPGDNPVLEAAVGP